MHFHLSRVRLTSLDCIPDQISRELARLMNGDLQYIATEEQGAKFRFTWPYVAPEPGSGGASPRSGSFSSGRNLSSASSSDGSQLDDRPELLKRASNSSKTSPRRKSDSLNADSNKAIPRSISNLRFEFSALNILVVEDDRISAVRGMPFQAEFRAK